MVGPRILGSTPSLQKRFGRNRKIKNGFSPLQSTSFGFDRILYSHSK